MELSERKDNDVTVLEVVGRVDSVTAPDLGAKLTSILSTPPRRVLIDFGKLEYISSAGFRVLFLASKQAGESGEDSAKAHRRHVIQGGATAVAPPAPAAGREIGSARKRAGRLCNPRG